jgi:hypothetical protein
LPAPPLPGLPPLTEAPAPQHQSTSSSPIAQMPAKRPAAPSAPQAARSQPGTAAVDDAPPGPPSPEGLALTSDAEDLVITLEADSADEAEEAPEASFEATQMSPADVPIPEPPSIIQPLARDEVAAALALAARRGDVADAIISYAVGLFDVVALCVMRDNMAFGWKAVGPELDRERIEALLIPLEAPSMFQSAMHKDNLFHETPLPGTMHAYLYRVLRCQPPPRATVAVISIGKRVVNFLYGHRNGREDLSEADLADLRSVCEAASEAYVRLIAASKRGEPDDERARPPDRQSSEISALEDSP